MVPDKWLVLTVHAPPAEALDDLVAELVALGGGAVEQEGDRLTTYLTPPDDVERFEADATARLSALAPGNVLEVSWRWQEHEDWAATWRRGLGPRRVGEHLIVTPSWSEPEVRPGDLVIVVDPEMAFGTGEHATTRGALRALEATVREGDRVLDVGTGSAILAIAAAKLGAREVLAVESDADAIENASDNIRRNGVADRVELLHGLVDDSFLALLGPGRFDVIVANVLSGVLIPLLPAFHTSLTPEGTGTPGRLILGGILDEEGETVIDAAERAGFKLLVEDLEDEWWGGLFEARRGEV
jgi:ribosomal protein L11 methyltransferase